MVNNYYLKAETLKIDSYETNFLPFFLVLRPLISSDQHGVFASKNIRAPEENIDSVDNILFYFSVMRDRYSPLPLCHPELAGNSSYPSSSYRE